MLRSVNGDDYMTDKPVTFKADTDLFHAIQMLLEHKITGATVLDDNNNVIGVISEMDCLKAILADSYHGTAVGGTVGEHMTKEVEAVPVHLDILEVARKMIDQNRRRLPIVDEDGVFVGQFSCRSILRAIKDFDLERKGRSF